MSDMFFANYLLSSRYINWWGRSNRFLLSIRKIIGLFSLFILLQFL